MTSPEMSVVALVGAGTIGRSWAIVFGRAGLETRVFDSDPAVRRSFTDRLDATLAECERTGALSGARCEAVRSRVRIAETLEEAVAGVSYVQESVPEDLDAKRSVFEALDAETQAETILASSASTFAMTAISAGVGRPERCVVVHPTNPPHLVPLVEIVAGARTTEHVSHAAYALMERLGQRPIRVRKEVFGFVLNRLQFALAREAFWLRQEGVASVADIDRCLTDGLALRWAFLGPFGVEATNADGIEDDLRKFRDGIRALMADVCRRYEGLDDVEIAELAAGVEEMFGGVRHADVVAYRDRMVAGLRRLKVEHPFPVAAGTRS